MPETGARRPPHRPPWPAGPTVDAVAELIRTLEVTVTRRLDGILHGNHHGITPGHGSEPGESRVYLPGDDVRRIDWNVTARTGETHVRDLIADRDLETWLVVDASASMHFGTTGTDKSQLALGAAATVGFLTARSSNRIGAIVVSGPELHVIPPRTGRVQVRAILSSIASAPPNEGRGRAAIGEALDRAGAMSRRRGFVSVISDLTGSSWMEPLGRLGLRHDLLAILVADPRELDVPPIGLVHLADPSTGATREVRVTPAVQRRFATRAVEQRAARTEALRRCGADIVELTTDGDWLGTIVRHVQRRRTQVVQAQVLRR